ncbi:kinesin-like protein KIN-12B [Wolffia australiana]
MRAFFRGKTGKTAISDSPSPNSVKKKKISSRGQKENVDPLPGSKLAENFVQRGPFLPIKAQATPPSRSPLPHRPPPNPNDTPFKKKKLNLENPPGNGAMPGTAMDSGVQIIVRMRPLKEEGGNIVQKIGSDCISIMEHTFTFDSVADAGSTQEEVFQLVGIPLVENCLSGFNSSIFAYGQTGSGKTHTMWGPPGTLFKNGSLTEERGLMPRVFEQLFKRMSQEEQKHTDTQLNFQCHSSFLEIYNEQITDLLNPSQKNLQIREDVRTGVYVDCLTEEYVCNIKDVTQVLLKGLANRRIGATSMNAESSRSHCVFTCIVESRSKSVADGINCLKVSRINLVDLAGSERQKLTCAVGERLKEAGNINRSLSQLGNVINILAEVSQTGKQRHIPYRDSKLTFLLQESLGGNAKLAMICAISPSQSCKGETFSTLRFAQRAKSIKNKAVVNEIKQDDVNVLRDQIRQLKEELLRMKSGGSNEINGNFSTGWNARKSLHLLKMSLCRPAKLPVIDDDNDEEMEIDERDVESEKEKKTEVEKEDFTKENSGPVFDSSIDLNAEHAQAPRELTLLEASIHHGLQVLGRSSVSFGHVDSSPPSDPVVKNDARVQIAATEPATEDAGLSVEKNTTQLPKAVEKVLAGAIRREMALEEYCARQTSEISQLKRLIEQYKHERECNSQMDRLREERISQLENLMDGILSCDEFMEEEFGRLSSENKLLKEKYENHPEVLRLKTEINSVKEELEKYRNFFDMGEREVLVEEIRDLKTQLRHHVDNPNRKRKAGSDPGLGPDPAQIEMLGLELESERRRSEELKEALHAAMQGHTRILDQFADLQEKHMGLLARHQRIRNGAEEVKREAGGDPTAVESLACQVSALRVERERERGIWREETRRLRDQVKDMAEAVEAAGELLVRLKEAEEASAAAQARAEAAEKERAALEQFNGPGEFSRGAQDASWFSRYDQCNV